MTPPKPTVKLAGLGRYLPHRVMTNHELEGIVDTSDEWIRERTGIAERRIAEDDVGAADMGAASAAIALERAGVEAADVDLLIVSTATPDRWLPSTACDIQARLGAERAVAFDLMAACSGWLYGLTMAEGYILAGHAENALVVAAEKMSSIVDWTDRSTCVLFGDGSGAAVVQRADGDSGILGSHHRSDGRLGQLLHRPAGGVSRPLTAERLARGEHLVQMSGREVFKSAIRSMSEASEAVLSEAGLSGDDVDLMVPHQANIRIIQSTARYTGIPMEKVFVNLDRYGNMSSASIPVALGEAAEEGRLKEGDIVLSPAFGAGLTWSAMLFRW